VGKAIDQSTSKYDECVEIPDPGLRAVGRTLTYAHTGFLLFFGGSFSFLRQVLSAGVGAGTGESKIEGGGKGMKKWGLKVLSVRPYSPRLCKV
jgi:hypothetical protein